MKTWFERLKEVWYRALPLLILFGVPTSVGIVIWIIYRWEDIPVILSNISDIGNGSLFYGIVLLLFGLIGLINAFIAFMMWFRSFTEWMRKKIKSPVAFWLLIVVVTFGWYALFKLIKVLF